MRTQVTETIYQAALKNKNIIFLTGDLDHEAAEDFRQNIPDQHINVGLAEQNMMGIAAGLALSGKKTFVFSITPFAVMRCFEQIRVDVCYQNLDVTVIGVGAGLAYHTSGCTHHAIEDIALMRALPNMKIYSPCHPLEAKLLTEKIIGTRGPSYLRIGRKNDQLIPELAKEKREDIESAPTVSIRSGHDILIFSTGSIVGEACLAAEELSRSGWSTGIINIHTLKPLDPSFIRHQIKGQRAIFTLEEHNIYGGLGSIVAEILSETFFEEKPPIFRRLGIEDRFTSIVGSLHTLRQNNQIDGKNITKRIEKILLNHSLTRSF